LAASATMPAEEALKEVAPQKQAEGPRAPLAMDPSSSIQAEASVSISDSIAPPPLPQGNLFGDFSQTRGWRSYFNKGDLSNLVAFLTLVGGFIWYTETPQSEAAKYLFSTGLFAFSGGVTNWVAIKMLFYRVPGLVGSGVIPRQFIAIRNAIKNMLMHTFFDLPFLRTYIDRRSKQFIKEIGLGNKLTAIMMQPEFDGFFVEKLKALSEKPEGQMLQTMAMMFGGIEGMAPFVKPLLVNSSQEFVDDMVENFDPLKVWSVEAVQMQLDNVVTEKLQLLTPEMITEMLDSIMHEHLGWLVIWGNVFGALIGIASQAAGFGAS